MTFLISTTETYRADSEAEAQTIIEEAKSDESYELSKYSCSRKEIKLKGEVIDDYYRVTLTKIFTSEKDPDAQITVSYQGDSNSGGEF